MNTLLNIFKQLVCYNFTQKSSKSDDLNFINIKDLRLLFNIWILMSILHFIFMIWVNEVEIPGPTIIFGIIMSLNILLTRTRKLMSITLCLTVAFVLVNYSLSSKFGLYIYSLFFSVISTCIGFYIISNVLHKITEMKEYIHLVKKEIEETKLNLRRVTEDLKNATVKLQEALKSQDLFVSCISHELRNPLNGLMGSIDLLEPEIKDETTLHILRKCKACGEALLTHISNILDMVKINSHKLEINEFPIRSSNFLANFWSIIHHKIEDKGLRGNLMVEKSVPLWLNIDAQRLQQILDNLIGNSIKFTSQGSIRVVFSWLKEQKNNFASEEDLEGSFLNSDLEESMEDESALKIDEGLRNVPFLDSFEIKHMSHFQDFLYLKPKQIEQTLEANLETKVVTDDGFLMIDVIDTGCGVSEETQSKIFEAFVQGDSSITRNYGGAGLGLYIVKKLVEIMKGTLKMKSLTNIGSSFQITLPIKKAKKTERTVVLGSNKIVSDGIIKLSRREPVFERPLSSFELNDTEKYRVLIVDDDILNQNLIKCFLKKLGVESDTANNGREGLDIYKRNPLKYTFITMDIQMPIMDGITAKKQIRIFENMWNRKHIPIVFVTGNCSKDEQFECLSDSTNEPNYFFRKPFRFSDCKICVEKIITGLSIQ